MVQVETLSKKIIVEINKQIPYKKGEGLMPGGGEANLDFVVYRTANTRGVNRKAAVVMKGIIDSHPFVDGNKRTGFIAAKTLLEANGKKLDKVHEYTKVSFTLDVANGKMSVNKMAQWFANHTRG
ncbi:MAG: type II toxin-antitoxin system death-on-curing family toxin [Candidatus Diapherotrites archaeon]|nr:type II toxin-antitoxin system death-on-curing family toxin [Candidatus Diapherotrites archaeon]